jgi:hypothetical protein
MLLGEALAPKTDLRWLSALTAAPPPPPNYANALSAFGGLAPTAAPAPVWQWRYVRRRFSELLENLKITASQSEDGNTKQAGVRNCLNRHYWDTASETANSMLIGSWGKQTRVRPPRDVDILFLLPASVYHRFQARSGSNRQSDLLKEVKNVLAQTYPQTAMRGDGQVVLVPFNMTTIEVSPGFRCQDGSIIVCDTNDGGSYKTSTAEAEHLALSNSDTRWNGNTRALARMMKQWQRECNVPLKSFQLERLAIEFLEKWPYSLHDAFWYDWMVRDFLAFLVGRVNTHIFMPGTVEAVWLGSEWLSRAQSALRNAVSACENEHDNYEALAGKDWQAIFGSPIPAVCG